jgi:hypothetical protein
MKRGNSILAAGCPRMRSFPSKAVSSSVLAHTDSAEEPKKKEEYQPQMSQMDADED